jgi:hypothetical protein
MRRRAAILSNLFFSFPLAASLLGAAPVASAQTNLVANIPFAFSANNQHLLAGRYQVQMTSDHFLYVRNVQTGKAVCLMVRPEEGRNLADYTNYGRLVFERTESGSYLTQVWTPGTSRHSELVIRPKHQEELAKQTPAVSTIELAAK